MLLHQSLLALRQGFARARQGTRARQLVVVQGRTIATLSGQRMSGRPEREDRRGLLTAVFNEARHAPRCRAVAGAP